MDEISLLSGHRCIVISNLRLSMSIGILPEEKQRRQEVVVNVRLYVPEAGRATSTNIEDYVSYADIVAGIQATAARGHVLLVENLAEDIADVALSDRRVARVLVDVRKTEIIPEAEGVGVLIERTNRPI